MGFSSGVGDDTEPRYLFIFEGIGERQVLVELDLSA